MLKKAFSDKWFALNIFIEGAFYASEGFLSITCFPPLKKMFKCVACQVRLVSEKFDRSKFSMWDLNAVRKKFLWAKSKLNPYIVLFLAIAFEVLGTMLLPASQNFTKLAPSLILTFAYCFSFYCLALIAQKLPLAIIYASWAGLGVFSVAILSYIIYGQALNWQTIVGLFLIILGVTIVNLFKTNSP